MIHISAVHTIMEMKRADGKRSIFSLKFVKASTGEVVSCEQCVCTSSYFANRTINIKMLSSGQVRKIHDCLIVEFNGQKVFL